MSARLELAARCNEANCTGTCHGDDHDRNEVCEYEDAEGIIVVGPSERRRWTCHHHRELTRDRGTRWSELMLTAQLGGMRHVLEGRDVHCGTTLVLQAVTHVDDDWGSFLRFVERGTPVRYESSMNHGGTTTLHADVVGHEFVSVLEPWMRFTWPGRTS